MGITAKKIMQKAQKVEKDLTRERNERAIPLAKELMKMMANFEDHKMGDVTREDLLKAYNPLAVQLLQKYLDANIQVQDVGAIHQFILQAYDTLNTIIVESLNAHIRRVQREAFGCDLDELQLKKLDDMLKRGTM